MEHKLRAFTHEIEAAAKKHGLIFVSGPNTEPAKLIQQPTIGRTNGQKRGVYLIGVAEA